MWTHLHPYLDDTRTFGSISRTAKIALWRAINLRRLLVVTGSGTTSPYGHPSWKELAQVFLKCTADEVEDALKTANAKRGALDRKLEIDLLIEQINALCSPGRKTEGLTNSLTDEQADKLDDLTLVMDLCEELLAYLPEKGDGRSRSSSARAEFAEVFRRDGVTIPEKRLSSLLEKFKADKSGEQGGADGGPDVPARPHDELERPNDEAARPTNALLAGLVAICANAEPVPAAMDLAENEKSKPDDTLPDPVREIFKCLDTRRVATLNYDVELERWILKALQAEQDKSTIAFRKLCSPPAPNTRSLDPGMGSDLNLIPAKVLIENGTQKGALSTTINRDNVGELVNFASFSRSFDYQVFHLHGRLDKPDEMVLTQRDYQATYLQEPNSAQALDAAQEILFGGNDVLLLGVGMAEEDVLRPFRRFVSRSLAEGHSPRRTFVLLPSRFEEKDWELKNQQIAVRHLLNYNILTLFFGGDRYRKLRQALDKAKNAIGENCKESDRQPDLREAAAWLLLTAFKIAREQSKSTVPDGFLPLISQVEIEAFTTAAAGLRRACGDSKRHRISAARELILLLESRLQGRALVNELRQLRAQAGEWWNTWRHPPHERRAIYHCASERIAGKPDYLWVRHCPDYSGQDHRGANWKALSSVAATGPSPGGGRDNPSSEGGLRVRRLTSSRGSGKGTVVSLLLHAKGQSELFAPSDGTGTRGPEYAAAFIAHLSFSLEFNSVVKAFTRFTGRQAARRQFHEMAAYLKQDTSAYWEVDGSGLLPKPRITLEGTSVWPVHHMDGHDHDNVAKGVWGIVQELTQRSSGRPHWHLLNRISDLTPSQMTRFRPLLDAIETDGHLTGSEDRFAELVRAVFISRREDEPALVLQPYRRSREELAGDPPREHRLDILRGVLAKYQELANGERCFVCFSGLDKICDEKGDGYNPAHRAFFRLLCRTEERDRTTGQKPRDPPDPPFDLVLISGRPEAPITYLSEEGPAKNDIKAGDLQNFSLLSGTGRVLKKWHVLERFTWEERQDLLRNPKPPSSYDEEQKSAWKQCFDKRQEAFLDWAKDKNRLAVARPLNEYHDTSTIHRLLWEDLALSVWVMRLWSGGEYITGDMAAGGLDRAALKNQFLGTFLPSLDRAGARSGAAGVLDGVLAQYRKFDEANEGPDSTYDAKLHDLLLRHLVLFALPVEPSVLIGCPMIDKHLSQLYERGAQDPDEDADEPGNEWLDVWDEWQRRAWKLDRLEKAFTCLVERRLAIRVFGASDQSGQADHDDFLHFRFAIHAKLRSHLAHKMRFSILDGGDQNHHQMSIYCDQPRDLPTPSTEHLKMVRDILDNQIKECRNTLAAAYRHGRVEKMTRDYLWDGPQKDGEDDPSKSAQAAAMRVFAPPKNPTGVADQLSNSRRVRRNFLCERLCQDKSKSGGFFYIHAVPQRLRGSLSLVQGSFSIGALSRLKNAERTHLHPQTPFEAYRSWLRGLINAAAGLERNRHLLNGVMAGHLLSGEAGDSTDFSHIENGDERDEAKKTEKRIRDAATKLKLTGRQSTNFRKLRHPFYRDEIAWLYNERGLTSLVQGRLFDALPLLQQARFIVAHRKTPKEDAHAYNAAERRIQLNYAIALIERGNLASARPILEELFVTSQGVDGSSTSHELNFARLYLGLCDHLNGNLQSAYHAYEECIKTFVNARQLRAVSIANRHLADLLFIHDRKDDAERKVKLAIKASSQAEQRDEQHLAQISHARILLERNELSQASQLIDRSLLYAKEMGLFRLSIDATMAQCRLMLKRGEHAQAGHVAAQSTAIAVRHGLRLRKISALLMFAETRIHAGATELAASILAEVKSEAERLGYQTRAARATDLLAELNTN